MNDVIDLAAYARKQAGTTTTGALPLSGEGWSSSVEVGGAGFLSASVLRKLDNDSALSRLFGLVELALARLDDCIALLQAEDNLGADDELMGCKRLFSEMLMFREINDTVGLLVVKLFQASAVGAIVDAPQLPFVLQRVLRRVWTSPFMKFEEACVLADEIEEAAALEALPGYTHATAELLAAFVDDPSAS